ncbi:MAG: ribonuclease D [Deltaproteobacteria bacterium]
MTSKSQRIPKLITDPKAVSNLCDQLRREVMIALDTEFIRETTFFPRIALIQVATQKEAWLIDPTVLDKEALAPLMDVLTDNNILKVIHASYADQECLYWAYGCIVHPVLDTSVAAALCGRGDNVGLQKLLKDELGINIPKGRSRVKWLARPLADELLVYAEEDVLHLVDLGLSLKSQLEHLNRWEWSLEESQSSREEFDVSPESMAQKMGKNSHLDNTGRAVLLELVKWRENRAKTKNVPRHWIMDNEVLLSLAKVRPRRTEELKTFRGLNAKEIERSGDEILKLVNFGIQEAKSHPAEEVRVFHRGPQLEGHVINLVHSYVALLAREHSIANRYLLNVAQIEWLLKESELSVSEWEEHGILTRRSSELIGQELKAFLQGKVGLVLTQGGVKVVKVN